MVIPTALLLGLIVGRTWAVPAAALAWTVLLIATGTLAAADIPSAAALGGANAAVGVLAHRAMLSLMRHMQAFRKSGEDALAAAQPDLVREPRTP